MIDANIGLRVAMEFGFKAREKGYNLEMARIKFEKILNGDEE